MPESYPHEFRRFFGQLEKLVRSQQGNLWKACCPAHEDNHPSLWIRLGSQGQVLLKCCKGCSTESVLKALELRYQDLYPEIIRKETAMSSTTENHKTSQKTEDKKAGEKLRFVKAYRYCDESGKHLYDICRFVGEETGEKHFMVRRPNPDYDPRDKGTKPWVWNLDINTPKVLYRLPELEQSMKENKERGILVVEGEKDADLAVQHGLIAITNPFGAGIGKWLESFSEKLRGRNVAVLADNDPPGILHAWTICCSLLGKAASVRLVNLPGLPEKGDFSDWWLSFDKDETPIARRKETLIQIIKSTPAFGPADARNIPETTTDKLAIKRNILDIILELMKHQTAAASGQGLNLMEWWGRMNVEWTKLAHAVTIYSMDGSVPPEEVGKAIVRFLASSLAGSVALADGIPEIVPEG